MQGYDAFISYSHSADGAFAPALQNGLQRLARPWNRRRALEVFRDQTGLSVTPHLWPSIVAALDTAEWFVLLASPESAESEWVGKEIAHWLERPGGRDRILPVVTGGVFEWAGDGFTAGSTAVNPALRDAFTDEPFYLDFSWARTSDHLDLANPQFRDSVAALAAPMHGKSKDELVGEDIRQFKLARRFRRAAVAGLATLTAAAVIATLLALKQKQQADDNAAQSRARELATRARTTMDDDPGLASLLAVEANYPNGATTPIDVPEAHVTLGLALRNRQWAAVTRVGPRITAPATHIVLADGRHFATIDYSRCTCPPSWWDARTGRPVRAPASAPTPAQMLEQFGSSSSSSGAVAFSPPRFGESPITDPFTVDAASRMLIGRDADGTDLVVQPVAGGPVASRLLTPPGVELALVTALPTGEVVALSTQGELYAWSRSSGGPARRITYSAGAGSSVRSVVAAGDHRILVESATAPGGLLVPRCSRVCIDTTETVSDVPPFSFVGTQITSPRLDLVDLGTSGRSTQMVASFLDPAVTVPGTYTVAPAAAGHRYVAARSIAQDEFGGAQVDVWDLDAGRLVAAIPSLDPTDLRWLDATTLAVASARGIEEFRLNVPPVQPVPTADLAVSADGRVTAALPDTNAATPARVGPEVLHRGAPTPTGTAAPPWRAASPGVLALSRDGKLAADLVEGPVVSCVTIGACERPRSVRVRRLGQATALESYPDATAAGFDPTGPRLAIGHGHEIRIVDTRSWHRTRTLPVPDVIPRQIVWSADGADLVVRGDDANTDSSVAVSIDPATGKRWTVTEPQDGYGIAVAPDGRTMATVGKGGIVRLWRRHGARVERTPIVSFPADSQPFRGLAFSPDSRLLVTSGHATAIWDLTNQDAPRRLDVLTDLPALARVHESWAGAEDQGLDARSRWGLVVFRSDGRSLLLGGPTGVVELADFDPALACSLASRADLAAARAVLGAPSACTRVPELQRARGSGPGQS